MGWPFLPEAGAVFFAHHRGEFLLGFLPEDSFA